MTDSRAVQNGDIVRPRLQICRKHGNAGVAVRRSFSNRQTHALSDHAWGLIERLSVRLGKMFQFCRRRSRQV